MSAENTANQEGGAAPDGIVGNDAAAAAAVSESSTSGTASSSLAASLSSATMAKPNLSEEHLASAHAALHNLAKDFKQLGIDFEAATKNAWEAQFSDDEK